MVLIKEQKKDCWSCDYQKIGGNTFLGICLIRNKEIPALGVDKGCSKFTTKCEEVIPQERKIEQLSLI